MNWHGDTLEEYEESKREERYGDDDGWYESDAMEVYDEAEEDERFCVVCQLNRVTYGRVCQECRGADY